MNWLDIVIIIFLAFTTITGLSRGLVKTVIPLLGIILGIVLAGHFYGSVANWLSHWSHSPSQAKIVGFTIILFLVVIVSLIIALLVSKFLKLLLLGWIDKLGGAVFGFVIGGLVCGAILTIITKYNFAGIEGSIQGSSLASFFVAHFNMALPLLPKGFDEVRQFFD
jgi:membrane protein required for colicin V production